jgi:hypothetical protein
VDAAADVNSYKPASTLLLDSTVSLCEGNAPPLCIKRDLLDAVEPTAWGSVDRRAMGNAFRIRNATSWRLANVSVALMVAPGAQIRSIFRNPLGWREVHAKCPGISSLIQVSAPVYRDDGRHALLSGAGNAFE